MHIIKMFFRCLILLCCTVSLAHAKTTFARPQRPISVLHEDMQNSMLPDSVDRGIPNLPNIPIKDWNIFVYIAGNNNLYSFIDNNLNQLKMLSGSGNVNFIVQVDKFGTRDVTRSIIQNNQVITYWRASDVAPSQRLANPRLYNSGGVENFIEFLQTGMTQFQARKQCVIVWDHGSGCIDPARWRVRKKSVVNDELTDAPFADPLKGMAFNDNYDLFLSNGDLTLALQTITSNVLQGAPIDLLGLDICHGGQIEIARQVKGLVNYVVASEETELGPGWNYARTFRRVSASPRSAVELAADILEGYKEEYNTSSPDYTLAFYDLVSTPPNDKTTYFEYLLQAMDNLAAKLLEIGQTPAKKLLAQVLTSVRKKNTLCCSFYDEEYIDLHLFLISLQNNLRLMINQDALRANYPTSAQKIQEAIQISVEAINTFYKVVPASVAGIAFSGNPIRARGMSISFPLRNFHSSYPRTLFAQNNNWISFVRSFLNNFK